MQTLLLASDCGSVPPLSASLLLSVLENIRILANHLRWENMEDKHKMLRNQ